MSNAIATILTIALIIDALANIARLISVELAYKRQVRMFKAESLESKDRIKNAADLVESIVRLTIDGIVRKPETSECDGCAGSGIDCADECIKPKVKK